jgi:hypothetical protein
MEDPILQGEEYARFCALEDVAITDAVMCEQLDRLRAGMDAVELKQFYSQRAVISERLGPETTLASSYMGV